MEWIIIIATLLGGMAAIRYFGEKIRRWINRNLVDVPILEPNNCKKHYVLVKNRSLL
jgi:hypothetical protein